jgi:zinc protease
MRSTLLLAAAFASATVLVSPRSAARAAPDDGVVRTPGGALTKTLANGLRVVVIENHAAPLAIINTWFTVGSRNEATAEHGMSHFLEHMLFDGSEGMALEDYNRFILTHAAFDNASTDTDNTNYWQLAPVRYFPELLKLNRTLVSKPLLLDDQFGREREVVKEELRKDLDDPSFFLNDLVHPKAFAHTGYDHSVIGDAPTLDGQKNEWMRAYYHKYYGPNNAFVLAIGDFDAAAALTQIEAAYGDWKRVDIAPAPTLRPFAQSAPQSLVGSGEFAANHVLFVWPTAKCGAPESYACDVLATILGGGESSRLAKDVKRSAALVTSVTASTVDRIDASGIAIEAEIVDVAKTKDAAEAILGVVAKLKADGPSAAELDRAKRTLALSRVFDGENLQQQAFSTGYYLVASGGPQYMESYADRVYGVTAADVQWAARAFLVAEHATLGLATGDEKAPALAPDWKKLGDTAAGERPKDLGRAGADPFKTTGAAAASAAAKDRLAGLVRFKLPNGIEVLLLRAPSRGTVGVSLATRDGLAFEMWDASGIGALMTQAITRGTKKRTGDQITEEMDALGGRWTASAAADTIEMRALYASSDLPRALDLLADLAGDATFPDYAVATERDLLLASITARADDSYESTHDQLAFAMYGKDSPYGRPPLGRPSVVAKLTTQDVRDFHRHSFIPANLVLAVVGDIDTAATRKAVEKAFGPLGDPAAENGERIEPDRGQPMAAPKGFTRIVVNVDKAQTMSVLGIPGVKLSDPDLPAVRVVNLVLGGTWLGRLFDRLRTKEGLCYGSYSYVESHVGDGALVAQIGTRPEMWDAAVSGLRREFKSIADAGVTQQEMTDAVNYWKGDSDRRHAGLQSQASFLATNVAMGLAPDREDAELAAMEKLDLATVNAVAKKRFVADKAWLAVTGPIYKTPAELK